MQRTHSAQVLRAMRQRREKQDTDELVKLLREGLQAEQCAHGPPGWAFTSLPYPHWQGPHGEAIIRTNADWWEGCLVWADGSQAWEADHFVLEVMTSLEQTARALGAETAPHSAALDLLLQQHAISYGYQKRHAVLGAAAARIEQPPLGPTYDSERLRAIQAEFNARYEVHMKLLEERDWLIMQGWAAEIKAPDSPARGWQADTLYRGFRIRHPSRPGVSISPRWDGCRVRHGAQQPGGRGTAAAESGLVDVLRVRRRREPARRRGRA